MASAIGNGTAQPDPGDGSIAALESELSDARAEIGRLQLQLHVFTTTDPLTGLANRNGLLDDIEMAVARHGRMREPYAVVGFRFDELDGLTDRHSDEECADALQHLAALLAAGLRTVDSVGRLDDVSFAAVLSNIVATNIPVVVDRTLAAITAVPFTVGVGEYALTPGVAAAIPGETPPTAEEHLDALSSTLAAARGAFTIDTLG